MNYHDIKKHINIENKDLLNFLQKDEIDWLSKHFKFINGLLMGRIVRKEEKYIQFVETIKNKKEPKTKEEKIYINFVNYFETYTKKSNLKKLDTNILYNGLEIFPDGARPSGSGVDNRDRHLDDDYW
tara:strand:+ start:270 stop:650 length:381 start_codon:yes stop_codon:yes gene_type:complete